MIAGPPLDSAAAESPTPSDNPALVAAIRAAIDANHGRITFAEFMALALYAPGLGYYANSSRKFGRMPQSGSDFVTAPELSPLFGQALAAQVAQALDATGTHEVWEFGAGSGALAAQLLGALGDRVTRYTIVDLSATLKARQQGAQRRHIKIARQNAGVGQPPASAGRRSPLSRAGDRRRSLHRGAVFPDRDMTHRNDLFRPERDERVALRHRLFPVPPP